MKMLMGWIDNELYYISVVNLFRDINANTIIYKSN